MQQVQKGDKVNVHYHGKLTDGATFDSSEGREPLQFYLALPVALLRGVDFLTLKLVTAAAGTVTVLCAFFLGRQFFGNAVGLLVAFCISLQTAFALGEKAQFQRIIYTEAQNLLTALIEVGDPDSLHKVSEQLQLLRKSGAENIPVGEGMGAVQKLTKELEAKRQ